MFCNIGPWCLFHFQKSPVFVFGQTKGKKSIIWVFLMIILSWTSIHLAWHHQLVLENLWIAIVIQWLRLKERNLKDVNEKCTLFNYAQNNEQFWFNPSFNELGICNNICVCAFVFLITLMLVYMLVFNENKLVK
jgi:hypothetical protein